MQSADLVRLVAKAIMVLIPMALSLTVHEYAHALACKRLGDTTAQSAGRLTLNPLAHADPVGTVLLPLSILVANGLMAGGGGQLPFFGWAKPTPMNAGRFNRNVTVRTGSMVVAGAGPLANILMALTCAALMSAGQRLGWLASGAARPLEELLWTMIMVNVALFVFNLIPLAPLDGHKVVSGLLSPARALRFEAFNAQYGSWILWGIIIFGRRLIIVPVELVAAGVLGAVGVG